MVSMHISALVEHGEVVVGRGGVKMTVFALISTLHVFGISII